MSANDLLKDRLQLAYDMNESVVRIMLNRHELLRVLNLLEKECVPVKEADFEKGYTQGFEYGYKRAIVDVVKRIKGMKWYGGDAQKHAGEMPGDYPGRTADLQR